MEQLNKVELRGIVGNVRVHNIGDTQMIRFSMATDYAFKNGSGVTVVETTWHMVTAFKNDRMPDFNTIERGNGIYVSGRLRTNRFTDSTGFERTVTEILAQEIKKV